MHEAEPRWVRLDGTFNARDLGGIPLAGGGRVRAGRLYRSALLDLCTPEDFALLRDHLGVRLVIDLRDRTRECGPGHLTPAGIGINVCNVPLVAGLDAMNRAADPYANGMGQFYLDIVERDRDQIVVILRTIAQSCDVPIWFHCSSGKDRTGLLAAILLDLLGASAEAIVRDYACTVVRPSFAREVVSRLGTLPHAIPDVSFRADAASMRDFLTRFAAAHGSAQEWALAGGLELHLLERLRSHLLEGTRLHPAPGTP